jgi:hypothetical protein
VGQVGVACVRPIAAIVVCEVGVGDQRRVVGHDDHVLQGRQVGLESMSERRVVDAAMATGHEQDPG